VHLLSRDHTLYQILVTSKNPWQNSPEAFFRPKIHQIPSAVLTWLSPDPLGELSVLSSITCTFSTRSSSRPSKFYAVITVATAISDDNTLESEMFVYCSVTVFRIVTL